MVINRESRHYRWYTLGLDLLTKIGGEDPFDKTWKYAYNNQHRDKTNLCHYMRTILLYTPFALLFTPFSMLAIAFGFVIFPLMVSGLKVTLITYAGAAAIVGVIVAGVALMDLWENRKRRPSVEGPSFRDVIDDWVWVDAKHRKVCPLISFSKEEGETS